MEADQVQICTDVTVQDLENALTLSRKFHELNIPLEKPNT